MKKFIICVAMSSSLIFTNSSFCADWKMYGAVDGGGIWYYDASSIKKEKKIHQLWTMFIGVDTISNTLNANPQFREKASIKVKNGYYAIIFKYDLKLELNEKTKTSITSYEVLANEADGLDKDTVLTELNCKDRAVNLKKVFTYKNGKYVSSEAGDDKFVPIPPNTNFDVLAKIVCEGK